MNITPFRFTLAAAAVAAALALPTPGEARVTRIVIDTTHGARPGQTVPTKLTGRAFGELDPHEQPQRVITDLTQRQAQREGQGRVHRELLHRASRRHDADRAALMWHDVPNRGGSVTISRTTSFAGTIGTRSGWQGDNAGAHRGAGQRGLPRRAPCARRARTNR